MKANSFDSLKFRGRVELILRDRFGNIKDHSVYSNVVTEVGDAHAANRMSGLSDSEMSHMAIGVGTGGGTGSTQLVNELARVTLDSKLQGGGDNDNDVTYSAIYPAGVGTGAITEAGVFNDATAGTLFCYTTFPVKNKGALDSLTINWTLTCGAS